ncbi:protein-tyrosine-phosphatase [Saprospiraceae bacterium]|nr:protein-tyrosine-phosphatase [Saprospiraceae bacterium]
MYSKLSRIIEGLDIHEISHDRQTILQALIDLLQENRGQELNLNFVCTHNSRRSHLAQIWCKVMSNYFDWNGTLNTFSSGTEATAMFPMIVETLIDQGYNIEKQSELLNPIYHVKHDESQDPQVCFSKAYTDDSIPTNNLSAIMVCSDADSNCPIIPNVIKRIPITYEDPKISDNTDQQKACYSERSLQIAREMKYVFSHLSNKM